MNVAAVAFAIALTAPWMRAPQRHTYAKAIVHASHHAHVPALLFVAIIENESRWHHSAVSRGAYFGLGQIGLENFRACSDPSTKACKAVQARLLQGTYNIAKMGKSCGPTASIAVTG